MALERYVPDDYIQVWLHFGPHGTIGRVNFQLERQKLPVSPTDRQPEWPVAVAGHIKTGN